jgi:di/tricarboxylate transporter
MAVNSHFEWMRIGIAMGLMLVAFVLLPMFFLARDRRARERAGAALGRKPDDTSSG